MLRQTGIWIKSREKCVEIESRQVGYARRRGNRLGYVGSQIGGHDDVIMAVVDSLFATGGGRLSVLLFLL